MLVGSINPHICHKKQSKKKLCWNQASVIIPLASTNVPETNLTQGVSGEAFLWWETHVEKIVIPLPAIKQCLLENPSFTSMIFPANYHLVN